MNSGFGCAEYEQSMAFQSGDVKWVDAQMKQISAEESGQEIETWDSEIPGWWLRPREQVKGREDSTENRMRRWPGESPA